MPPQHGGRDETNTSDVVMLGLLSDDWVLMETTRGWMEETNSSYLTLFSFSSTNYQLGLASLLKYWELGVSSTYILRAGRDFY